MSKGRFKTLHVSDAAAGSRYKLESLQDSSFLHSVVHRHSQDTRRYLGHDVGNRTLIGDATVVQGHQRYRRVEVTARDRAAEEG